MTLVETVNALAPVLTFPIFTAAVVALAPFAIPTIRWNRRLKNDLGIYKDLPDGSEKERYKTSIEGQAARLNDYREFIPRYEKIGTWLAVPVFVALSMSFVLQWDAYSDVPLPELIFTILGSLLVLAATIGAFTGRTTRLLSPRGQKSYEEQEIAGMNRQARRRVARRRLRRMRQAERQKK